MNSCVDGYLFTPPLTTYLPPGIDRSFPWLFFSSCTVYLFRRDTADMCVATILLFLLSFPASLGFFFLLGLISAIRQGCRERPAERENPSDLARVTGRHEGSRLSLATMLWLSIISNTSSLCLLVPRSIASTGHVLYVPQQLSVWCRCHRTWVQF